MFLRVSGYVTVMLEYEVFCFPDGVFSAGNLWYSSLRQLYVNKRCDLCWSYIQMFCPQPAQQSASGHSPESFTCGATHRHADQVPTDPFFLWGHSFAETVCACVCLMSRFRTLFLDHLELHFSEVLSSAVAMVSERKDAVRLELELQLLQLNPEHIQTHICQPRLGSTHRHTHVFL